MDNRAVNSTSWWTWWECRRSKLVITSVWCSEDGITLCRCKRILIGCVSLHYLRDARSVEHLAGDEEHWLQVNVFRQADIQIYNRSLLKFLRLMLAAMMLPAWREQRTRLKSYEFPKHQTTVLQDTENICGGHLEGLCCISLHQDFHHWCGNPSSDAQVAASYERDQLSQVSCHQSLVVIPLPKARISFLYFSNFSFWELLLVQSLYVH